MRYLEWNNLISKHFFNPDKAGKNVLLFITKSEIIKLAKESSKEESDAEIWQDFFRVIKAGLSSDRYPYIFDKARHLYEDWKRTENTDTFGKGYTYPPYLSYLVFCILPLIEIQGDYNANNYYDRLDDFLKENNINQNLRGKLAEIDNLWSDLSKWANKKMNGELGNFKNIEFKSWKFVGKPFSQCVLTPKAIKKLPDFFDISKLIPGTFYEDEIFQNSLIRYGPSILGLKPGVIELIRKGNKDEIGHSIIETVKTEFNEWTGDKHELITKDGRERKIRNNTTVPIKLQFKINEDGEIDFSFRVKYSSEPPEELKLDEFEDIYENEVWSRTLRRPFKEYFELKDVGNKWIAKFESKSIRLFIRGGYFQLGNDFWIETEALSRVEEMYVLCKNDIRESIQEWIAQSCSEFKKQNTFTNLPIGYSLFSFKNPQNSHKQFQQLRVYRDKKILLRRGTGLKIGYRTYLNEMLPQVEIINADGKESVYLQYDNNDEKIGLNKHPSLGEVWLLPNNLLLNSSFYILLENEPIEGYKQTYKIDEPFFKLLSNESIPKRNKYNARIESEIDFIQGNKIIQTVTTSNIVDEQSFRSINKAIIQQKQDLKFKDNYLLKWLVGIKECAIDDYNEVFEIILHNLFEGEQLRVQERRKSSINILDYLGYVDYSYQTGKIFTLPPKLILIPSSRGRRALLLGGRDENLVNEMIAYCEKSNHAISLSLKKQSEKNIIMLIPDAIICESKSSKEFEKIANYFQIEYDKWYLLKLKEFLPTLSQYEEVVKEKGNSESWERFGLEKKVFIKETLKFESAIEYDRTYSLTECRPSYLPEYGLWINKSYYTVDKNWGKYLLINHYAEKVRGYGGNYFSKPVEIFFNANNLAIPSSLPLPKLISRLIMQLSGEAPEFRQLNLKGKKVWYNVYRNVPSLFLENFFKFKLNMIIETTTQVL